MATLLNLLRKFIAPALPQPPEVYEQRFFDKFNGILRIYFNQIDNAIGVLLGNSGVQWQMGNMRIDLRQDGRKA